MLTLTLHTTTRLKDFLENGGDGDGGTDGGGSQGSSFYANSLSMVGGGRTIPLCTSYAVGNGECEVLVLG